MTLHSSIPILTPYHNVFLGVKRSESEMKDGIVDLSSDCTPYSTFSMTFGVEDYDRLVKLSEYNILNNQHLILQGLLSAVERKKMYKK